MHREPLWVGNSAVHTSAWSRNSALEMKAEQVPILSFPVTKLHGATAQKTTTSVSSPWKFRITQIYIMFVSAPNDIAFTFWIPPEPFLLKFSCVPFM